MFENIRADIAFKKNWFRQEENWWTRNVVTLLEAGTIVVIIYRYGRWTRQIQNPFLRLLLRLPYYVVKILVASCTQIHISSRANIGKGFAIHAFSNIYILDATFGENCIVYHGVFVGHLRHYRGKGRRKRRPAPRIGNNVILGTGCKVLGDVVIGNNVMVGANSLVIAPIPANCSVLGVPARIVSRQTNWIRERAEQLETKAPQ